MNYIYPLRHFNTHAQYESLLNNDEHFLSTNHVVVDDEGHIHYSNLKDLIDFNTYEIQDYIYNSTLNVRFGLNTEYIPNLNTKIITTLSVDRNVASYPQNLFGNETSYSDKKSLGLHSPANSIQAIQYQFGNISKAPSASDANNFPQYKSFSSGKVRIFMNRNYLNFDKENTLQQSIALGANSWNSGNTNPLLIYKARYPISSGYGYSFVGKVYYFLIYDNNIKVRHYIPVKNISQDSYGLYDLITKQYLTNSNLNGYKSEE